MYNPPRESEVGWELLGCAWCFWLTFLRAVNAKECEMTKHATTDTAFRNELSALERKLGTIEYRRCDTLKAYANNPRRHPQKQLVKLAASIREFGFVLPILVSEGGEIITGEARVAAAKDLGMAEVPVLVASELSPAQVRAYRLADNRLSELAEWDKKKLVIELAGIIELDEMPIELLGWDMGEVDALSQEIRECDGADDPVDQSPEKPAQPVSAAGDLWLLGKHRLLCGSSLEQECWVRLMNGKTGAMLFEDPPFNVPVTGHVCGLGKVQHSEFAMASGEMSKAEFTTFLSTAFARAAEHLKEGAILTVAMDWRHCGEMVAALENNKLGVLNLCVWIKSNGGMGSLYRSQHELFWIAKKGKAPHTNNVELGKHGRYRTNAWSYAGVNSFGRHRMDDLKNHPTVKPTALVADAIRDVTKANDIVLDGFLGSGTTILAAQRTGRIAYGIEIDPGYIDVAIRRWQDMTGEQAVLEASGQSFAEVAQERLSGDLAESTPA